MTTVDLATIRPLLQPAHEELAERLERSVAASIAPLTNPTDDDEARAQAREVLQILGREGWTAYAVPPAYGESADAPGLTTCCLIREALAWHSSLADAVFALQCLGSAPVALGGSQELQLEWLPAVAAGHAMAAFAMTEPEAGSDVRAIQTTARRDGDGYLLSGRKWFISNAGLADFYVVFARLDGAADSISHLAVLVEAESPGLTFVGPQTTSAPHPLGEIALEECRVPASQRLGAEGEGLPIGLATLDRLRPTVAAAACGMAARAFAEARRHAAERRQFGRALGEQQLVQAQLADMATELDAARLLTYRAAAAADAAEPGQKRRAAEAKLFATEVAQRVVDRSVQILGGRGVLAGGVVEHLYRAVRALRIYEGTSEIQRLVIARELGREAEEA